MTTKIYREGFQISESSDVASTEFEAVCPERQFNESGNTFF